MQCEVILSRRGERQLGDWNKLAQHGHGHPTYAYHFAQSIVIVLILHEGLAAVPFCSSLWFAVPADPHFRIPTAHK